MGDHPVVWTNPEKPTRNVYFQFGHSKSLFDNSSFVKLLENSIHWALKDDE
jgi:type 1 glutamine amidotransferase